MTPFFLNEGAIR